jgi:hypothetical protein
MERRLSGLEQTWPGWPSMSAFDLGCVKTRLGEGRAELFSQLPSSERSYQYNRLLHRRNRDGSSKRKLGVGVFTQPGSFPTKMGCPRHVRSTPDSDQTADIAGGPVRASDGHRATSPHVRYP